MADQGRWFKLWASAVSDPDLRALSLEDFGRWCAFGIYLKMHGKDGRIDLRSPALPIQELLRLTTFDAVVSMLQSFPNCKATLVTNSPVTLQVEWGNWQRYQGDYSGERVKRWRDSRKRSGNANVTPKEEKRSRRDEKRREVTPRETLSGKPDVAVLQNQANEILQYLNKRSGRAFRPSDTNVGIIVARLKDGATLDQCRAIIGLRAAKWKGDPKMEEYLRPLTIFRKSNFEQYLGDLPLHVPEEEGNG